MAVVIPAFNPGSYLSEALDSVVSQTFTDWEAVVVDDGSAEDISFVKGMDPRIRLLRQANSGVAAARNAGIAATSASLIAFLDQDDLWLPGKLGSQVSVLSSDGDAALCSTDFEVIDATGEKLGPGYREDYRSYLELLHGCGICASTVMVRRDVLDVVGMFDVRYQQAPDWDLWLRIAKEKSLARVETVQARYRIHDSNFSRDHIDRLLAEGTEILRGHQQGREARSAAHQGVRRLRRLVGSQAYDLFRERKRPTHLWVALRLSPRRTLSQLVLYLRNRLP